MPKIIVKNNGQTVETTMVRSILVALQIAEVPIQTICGGKAICGKCVIRILEGDKYLSPIREREAIRLKKIGTEADMRLACQTYAGRDIVIEIVNFGRESKTLS